MITEWDMYWLTRMDNLHFVLVSGYPMFWLGLISTLGMTAGHHICLLTSKDEGLKERTKNEWIGLSNFWRYLRRWSVAVFLAGLVLSTGAVMLPTTNQYAAIKVIPAVANNEDLQGLGKDIVSLAKEWVEELRPKKEVPAQ